MKTWNRRILGTLLLWPTLALSGAATPNAGEPAPPSATDPGGQGTIDGATGPWDMGASTTGADGGVSSTDTFRSTGTGNGGQDGAGTMPNPAGTPNPPAPPQR